MSITLAVQCQYFERRLCWLMSSLLEQTCRDFIVSVAFVPKVGSPTCEDVLKFFRLKGVEVWPLVYHDQQRFQQRGYTRNDQLRDCQTEWMWFADCDHVYNPEYVERLLAELENRRDETKLITAGRMSTTPGVDPFEFNADYPVYHRDAFARAKAVPNQKRRGSPGAGHTQIVRVANLPDLIYVPEGKSRDHKWSEKGTKAKSDIQFRRKLGGSVKLPRWFQSNQIHLNHRRDSKDGEGQHLTEQR